MGLSLEGDHALDVLHLEEVARGLVGRGKLLDDRTLRESHIVLIGRENLVGVLLGGLLDHAEKRRLHLLAVDDELSAEDLVAAVLGVDLGKTEDLAVGERTAVLLLQLVEISHLVLAESKTFLLVVLLEVIHVLDGFRLVVDGEHLLVDAVVHTLQHRVVVGILAVYGEVLLNTRNAVKTHVLSNLNGIRTPGSNHFTAWADKVALQLLGIL